MKATMKDYLHVLFDDSGLVELRHNPRHKIWDSYWYDDPAQLMQKANALSGAGNLYTSLNAPKLRKVRNGRQQEPIGNDDIAFITRLPFDFDPVRPAGCCSTDEELVQATVRMKGFVLSLYKRGWPIPCTGMSGNGYHLQYRCRLPNTDETKQQLKAIYTGLATEFGDDVVQFDTSVRNPGRIFRLYGTTNRKGRSTALRPHRMATVTIPEEWQQVTRKQIETLANAYYREPASYQSTTSGKVTGKGDYATLDIVRWFQSHGLYGAHIEDNKHEIVCPWEHEHSSTTPGDTIIFQADGSSWGGFHCKHSHCQDRDITHVMELFGDADTFCSRQWRAS